MSSVVAGSGSRTSSARRKTQVTTAAPSADVASPSADWSHAQTQRKQAKQRALGGLKQKPAGKPE